MTTLAEPAPVTVPFLDTVPRCYIHDVAEPDLEGDFTSCGECFHVFRTAEDLVAATALRYGDLGTPGYVAALTRDPKTIFVCPLCAHDL